MAECEAERVADELARIEPAEVLVAEGVEAPAFDRCIALTRRAPHDFGRDTAHGVLTRFFGTSTLEGFGIAELPRAVAAAGALVAYLEQTQLAALPHIRGVRVHRHGAHMTLDRATRASLELVDTLRGEGHGVPLVKVVDRTRTPMGARLLREWLLAPLADAAPIHARQAAVAELVEAPGRLGRLGEALGGVLDLQRLTTRISCGRANGRDLVGLGRSLEHLPAVRAELEEAASERLCELFERLDPLEDVAAVVAGAIVDEPPTTVKDGGLIRDGHDAELDELRMLARDSKRWLAEFQAREAERLGVPNLKVGFNRVFGYYIEITHGNKGVDVPPDYVRKQTTKNAERYVTAELETFQSKVLKAEDNSKQLEYELFDALRAKIAAETGRLQATAEALAEIDVLAGLAKVASERGYCRPVVDQSRVLKIEDGRHPVIEATHQAGTFVPNDTDLDPPERMLVLLTGPNMAGKSTWIRQNALIVLLAQIGSFVPARSAHVGVVDRVFTRVGAADDISRGASTFMVEMTETANILNNATERSLVILDEVGRGTSTFDGLALAWSIAEDLHDRVGCRALFATHYHQLTTMAADCPGVVNRRVAVKEWGDEIVFLHRIEEGATDRSYGLHVGRLAGLPGGVLERAREVLDRLETEGEHVHDALARSRGGEATATSKPTAKQLSLFEDPREKVMRELERVDIDALSPREAWGLLAEWVKGMRGT